jgi:hypothetical protein
VAVHDGDRLHDGNHRCDSLDGVDTLGDGLAKAPVVDGTDHTEGSRPGERSRVRLERPRGARLDDRGRDGDRDTGRDGNDRDDRTEWMATDVPEVQQPQRSHRPSSLSR